jgi:hypothetical protein
MSESVDPSLPCSLPELDGSLDDRFRVVAARRRPDPTQIVEAFAFTNHDVLGIVACLTPDSTSLPLDGWSALRQLWEETGDERHGPTAGVLGEAALFTALVDGEADDLLGRFDESVRSVLGETLGPGDALLSAVVAPGVALWASTGSAGHCRALAAIAPPAAEKALDAWAWWGSRAYAAPLVRCLMHSAKLDYEAAVYAAGIGRMRERERDVDASLDELVRLHGQIDRSGPLTTGALLEAQTNLTRLQADSTGLLVSMTRLRELEQTVKIAGENLRIVVPQPSAKDGRAETAPLGDGLETAEWLTLQIAHDIAYGEAVRERVEEVRALTSLRLQQAVEWQTRRQARVTLIQTTLLGALVAALGASRTLGVGLDPGRPLRVPILIAFVAVLLALPALLAHWYDGYGWFDYVAVSALLAATAAVGIVLVWRDASTVAIVTFAVLGGAAAVPVMRRVARLRSTRLQ